MLMPLVPKLELDQALKEFEELEEKFAELEADQVASEERREEDKKRIEELEAIVELGRKKPAEGEISLLLLLEEEVRKADHPVTHHQYDPDRLQWILDRLESTRCTDPKPKEESDPDSGPGLKKSDPPEENPNQGLKLCADEDVSENQLKLTTP